MTYNYNILVESIHSSFAKCKTTFYLGVQGGEGRPKGFPFLLRTIELLNLSVNLKSGGGCYAKR